MLSRSNLYYYDGIAETWEKVDSGSLVIKGNPAFPPAETEEDELQIRLQRKKLEISFLGKQGRVYWNGEVYRERPFTVDMTEHHCFVFRGRPGFIINFKGFSPPREGVSAHHGTWKLYRADTGEILSLTPREKIPALIRQNNWAAHQLAALPEEITTFDVVGIWIRDIFREEEWETARESEVHPIHHHPSAHDLLPEAGPDDAICPACWLPFDESTVMAIAAHEDLTDPILGENERLRYYPTVYTGEGIPVDSRGLPSSGLACPHCRIKLPRDYLAIPHHIFSLVGASQSGKTYFLTILIRVLQRILFQRFGITFRDEDPHANAILSDMRNKLFQGISPRQAALLKTQLEGEMYLRLKRYGQEVSLPRPFSFTLTPENRREETRGLIFYDNAGEHFQPGVSIEDSPGALHVAVSSAIFFLFDPAPNVVFRKRLPDHQDPQLKRPIPDIQDVIVAEMENRIKRLRNLRVSESISTPLAVMIGKADIWMSLLGEPPLEPALTANGWDSAAVLRNSARLRAFLTELEPSIVANAEALSDDVCYFAVSAFGHSPEKFVDPETGAEYLAPDPAKLEPYAISDPILWALMKVSPGLFPPP